LVHLLCLSNQNTNDKNSCTCYNGDCMPKENTIK